MSKNKKFMIIGGICLALLVLAVVLILLLVPGKTGGAGITPTAQGQLESGTGEASSNASQDGNSATAEGTQTNNQNGNDSNATGGNSGETTNPQAPSSGQEGTVPSTTGPAASTTDPSSSTTDPTASTTDPTTSTTDPTTSTTDPTTSTTDPTPPPTTEPAPSVTIPVEDEDEGVQFPCDIPGHDLRIEKLAPYDGVFVEDGTNRQVTDVAMLLIHNYGNSAVEYTEIAITFEETTLAFHISMLPAGESLVVQELNGQSIPEGVPLEASALVIHRTQSTMAQEISVTDNGDDSLTITNLTGETIPTVRVFYKYYMAEEDLFVGGIAFTIRITNLSPNDSVVICPSHYLSSTSLVVMGQIYDTNQ